MDLLHVNTWLKVQICLACSREKTKFNYLFFQIFTSDFWTALAAGCSSEKTQIFKYSYIYLYMTWFGLSGGSLAETDTQKTSATLKSSTKCNRPFQTRSSRVWQKRSYFWLSCVPEWRRSLSGLFVQCRQISLVDKLMQHGGRWRSKDACERKCGAASNILGIVCSVWNRGVSDVVGWKTGVHAKPVAAEGFAAPFIAREEIPACSRVQIASFHVNRQQSHSYHYSLIFFLSKSTLIALITLNCPPRAVDPSLPVICL